MTTLQVTVTTAAALPEPHGQTVEMVCQGRLLIGTLQDYTMPGPRDDSRTVYLADATWGLVWRDTMHILVPLDHSITIYSSDTTT
jgi:hypothetical protein